MSDIIEHRQPVKTKRPRKEWSKPELVEVDSGIEGVNGMIGPTVEGVESITS